MSKSDQMILRGRVGTGLTLRRAEDGGRSFARFRMVVPRSRRKDDGQWEDGEPQWYTVRAWGSLAEHLSISLHKGQPIIVIGRPAVQAWISRTGELRSELAVNAITAGHDLGMGVGMFSRFSVMMGSGSDSADAVESSTPEDASNAAADLDSAPAGGGSLELDEDAETFDEGGDCPEMNVCAQADVAAGDVGPGANELDEEELAAA